MTRKTIPTLEDIGLLHLGEQSERIATDLVETGIQVSRQMAEAMRYARPVEFDKDAYRHLREQMALTRPSLTDSVLSASRSDTNETARQMTSGQEAISQAYEAVGQRVDSMGGGLAKLHEEAIQQARATREAVAIEPPVDIARMFQDLLPQKPLHQVIGDMASQALGAAQGDYTVSELSNLFREQQKGFEGLFAQIDRPSLGNLQRTLTETFLSARQDLDALTDTQVRLGERGELVVDGQELEAAEVRQALAELGLGGVGSQESDFVFVEREALEETIRNAVRRGLKKPRHIVALLLLLQFILNILAGMAAAYLVTALYEDGTRDNAGIARSIQKQISRSAKQLDANPTVLRTLRIVMRVELSVFKNRRQRSGKVAVLHLGDVVTLLERRRNWALVEHGSGDDLVRGWVFARYLGKLTFEPEQRSIDGLPKEFACD